VTNNYHPLRRRDIVHDESHNLGPHIGLADQDRLTELEPVLLSQT
jgi:hypothetical protein